MVRVRKTPTDILDDVYSLAYWMTGSEHASEDLVSMTYSRAGDETAETELLKLFRKSYVDRYGQHAELHLCENGNGKHESEFDTMRKRAADVRLSVLLSEICGLRHKQISDIMEKPVETVRSWLFWGRKSLVMDRLLKASA